jgi:hypothetical protein
MQKVELFDVALKGCSGKALLIPNTSSETAVVATRCEFANSLCGAAIMLGGFTSATFKNCVFHDNKDEGIFVSESTIHLHGEATAIHSNGQNGINAGRSGKVLIHLPSNHNTFYNNGGQDRSAYGGGTITNVED